MSKPHSLIPTYMLKRVAGIFPEDLTKFPLGGRGRRAVNALREFLARPPVTADVLVVGEFHYLDEDMGSGYYVRCTKGLPEALVDEEMELMTVAQHQRIVARYQELLAKARHHLYEHAMEYKHPGQHGLIADIDSFMPKMDAEPCL
uniref:Uncharacterized protein n=1 Tax=Pseudomonas phage Cygsa01 TaxID=3138529 RepID=A0AAU6W3S9_9VIRU